LFPVLVRGEAYGIVNFICRPFSALATLVTEYTTQPCNYILGFAVASMFSIYLITEIDEDADGAKNEN
jgi:hypothetical protein